MPVTPKLLKELEQCYNIYSIEKLFRQYDIESKTDICLILGRILKMNNFPPRTTIDDKFIRMAQTLIANNTHRRSLNS